MKQLIIVVQINSVTDYCTVIMEKEALFILKCMSTFGINARLEYIEPPGGYKTPQKFDWSRFVLDYMYLTKRQYMI